MTDSSSEDDSDEDSDDKDKSVHASRDFIMLDDLVQEIPKFEKPAVKQKTKMSDNSGSDSEENNLPSLIKKNTTKWQEPVFNLEIDK